MVEITFKESSSSFIDQHNDEIYCDKANEFLIQLDFFLVNIV